MHCKRIIPRLDIKGDNLVKGIHLEGLRIIGRPWDFAQRYCENGADELLYMDSVASLYGRNSLHDIIRKTSENIFIPLSVGGGLRSLEDIQSVLTAGADKVVINSIALKKPVFISQAAQRYGSSTITVSIQTKKQYDGTYKAFYENGRENSGKDVVEWAKQVVQLGAGEIILTSVDKEGTSQGFDLDIIKTISSSVTVPVVVCGGAGKLEDVKEACTYAQGVGLASMLHYMHVDSLNKEGLSGGGFRVIEEKYSTTCERHSIGEIKDYLTKNNFKIRPIK